MDKKIRDLWEITEKTGIEVRYTNLHNVDPELDGLYLWFEEIPIILLDVSLTLRRQLFRCVFAEEIGHYYTATRSNFLIVHPSYSEKIGLSLDEYKAMCWATDYLIPDHELINAVQTLKIKSCFELAEYFDVTQSFFMHKLAILKKRNRVPIGFNDIFNLEPACLKIYANKG